MNKEKYYTPKIEKLFIGYECETYKKFYENDKLEKEEWSKIQVIPGTLKYLWENPEDIKRVRTPYLHHEQIEKEGWNHNVIENKTDKKDFSDSFYTKDNLILRLYQGFWNSEILSIRIVIMDQHEGIIYKGCCPSINEFRTIINLLNI